MTKKIVFLALGLLFVGGAPALAQDTLDKDWSDPSTGGGDCSGCSNCVQKEFYPYEWDCEDTAYGQTGRDFCTTNIWNTWCDDWGVFCECIEVQGSLQSGTTVERLAAFRLLPGAADVEEYFRPLGGEAGACL